MNPREASGPRGTREETDTRVNLSLSGLPLEMTHVLSTGSKWRQEDNKG